MPTGLYTHCDLDSETSRLIWQQITTLSFENIVTYNFQPHQIQEIKASLQQADKSKKIALAFIDFVIIAKLSSKQWFAFITFVSVKKYVRPSLTE